MDNSKSISEILNNTGDHKVVCPLVLIQVQSMNENCIELRHEGARLLEEKKQESARRKALEEAVAKIKAELGNSQADQSLGPPAM